MRKTILSALLAMSVSGALQAADVDQAVVDTITGQLMKVDARIPVESVLPSQMPGIYEVVLGTGEVLYADEKGEYFMLGQLYRLNDEQGFVNLTEEKLKAKRQELIAGVAAEDRISFKPEGEVKATIAVFTDVDCPYCRKLHQEVDELNALGIQVDYLAFPRGGERSGAYAKMQSIWCNDPAQRPADMTRVKSGGSIEPKDCDSPVMEQFALGQKVGVTGTPALVFPDGSLVPGYVPADRLAQMLGLNAVE
ncbi:glutaredoxin [Marinobacterium nitratireducens]|uniref:Thiol:disulfide interchange protein n=1 Tax=Marinobacterium nitratireducens TaxID=518897 RepID=A0A917Z9N3_9GAMM|nr:DsbC family protein [Marinobacterium nitratireducens]GGO78590.1 glutaredoxin [Marinobacterium nitratireducens]